MEQKGVTVWFTGMSGAGKTALAVPLEQELRRRGLKVERLDGDIVRESLTRDLGFSKEDRDRNIERVTFVAKLLTRNGVIVLCSFISPYRAVRAKVAEEVGNFVEVYCYAPLETLIERDVKGLYKKALAGETQRYHWQWLSKTGEVISTHMSLTALVTSRTSQKAWLLQAHLRESGDKSSNASKQ